MTELIPIGAIVKIGPKGDHISKVIEATVTSINLRGRPPKIQYEVGWWDNREYKSQWFEEFQIEEYHDKYYKMKIGFGND
jgi:hypothetical protein